MPSAAAPQSPRVRVKRLHLRGAYDRATIDAILDAGMICHVGYVFEDYPVVTPTLYWRDGDRIYWHGSSASRMLRAAEGSQVCLTVTHLDGLVLARSAFHHSANYRSVMLFGAAEAVTGDAQRLTQMQGLIEAFYPGRWAELRPIQPQELKATQILSMAIDEASAKVRTGGPSDAADDRLDPAWAGVIPIRTSFGAPQADDEAARTGRLAPVLAERLNA